jgi:FtsP/CotA-like multicopper oxidase with cupredoxin domain
MILVNGAYPGPTIEANVGDTFKIKLINNIDDHEGTAIHWHGLFQKDTPWMDGVPSVTFCPIIPGGEFTYEFKADRVGSSWWHSHYSAQTAAGLLGPMIIHGASLPYNHDIDLGPVLLSDHLHIDYRDMVSKTLAGELVLSSNTLINGKMNYNCSSIPAGGPSCEPNAGFSNFKFQCGKKHLLRLINAAAEALQHFTIDGHNFTVVGLDYTPIKPYETDMISLTPGQRADIIVKGLSPSNANAKFWMRSDVDPTCSGSSQPHAKAIILYQKATEASGLPTSDPTPYTLTGDCVAQPLSQTEPLEQHPLPLGGPTYTQDFNFTLDFNHYPPNASLQFIMNGRQFRANYSQSLLSITNQAKDSLAANEQYGELSNVWDFSANKTVRLVVYNFFISPHPMHLHGHDFWVLAEGKGVWDGHVQGNRNNPMRRDTHQMIGGGADGTPSFLVLEFELNNPGVWAFHCHISL